MAEADDEVLREVVPHTEFIVVEVEAPTEVILNISHGHSRYGSPHHCYQGTLKRRFGSLDGVGPRHHHERPPEDPLPRCAHPRSSSDSSAGGSKMVSSIGGGGVGGGGVGDGGGAEEAPASLPRDAALSVEAESAVAVSADARLRPPRGSRLNTLHREVALPEEAEHADAAVSADARLRPPRGSRLNTRRRTGGDADADLRRLRPGAPALEGRGQAAARCHSSSQL